MGKKNIADIRVNINNFETTFNEVKSLQALGIASKKTRLDLNGVKVPVRFFQKFEQFFGVYESILRDEYDLIIESLPDNLCKKDVFDLLYSCSNKHHYIMNAAQAKSLAEKYIENKKNRVTQKAKLQ